MGRTLRGELRKLAHPVSAIIVIVCFFYILTDARTTYNYAQLQVPGAVVSSPRIAAACTPHAATLTAQCQAMLDHAGGNDTFAANGIALARVTNSLSTWPGILRFVSHQLATGLGWILLAVLIGVHVAGEWSTRTAAATLVATASRRRFWAAKIASIWIAMIGITVLGTTVLYLARSNFLGTTGPPSPLHQHGDASTWHLVALPPDSTWSSWADSAGVLGLTSVIWLLLLAVGVAVAGLIRKTTASVGLLVASLATMLAFARYGHRTAGSPIAVIGRVLDLAHTPFGVRDSRLWSVPGAPGFIQDTPHAASVDGAQLLACIAIALLMTVLAAALSSRRRVRG